MSKKVAAKHKRRLERRKERYQGNQEAETAAAEVVEVPEPQTEEILVNGEPVTVEDTGGSEPSE